VFYVDPPQSLTEEEGEDFKITNTFSFFGDMDVVIRRNFAFLLVL